MKTLKHYLSALRLAIMGAIGFLNWASSSMGAKQGSITAPTGADENMKTLGVASPVRDTLAGIVRSAFQLATALKKAVINYGTRKAVVVPIANGLAAAVDGVADVRWLGTLTKDDASKSTSPWTFAGEGEEPAIEAEITAITATKKPSLSAESLLNAIEDVSDGVVVDAFDAEASLAAVIDQTTGEILLYLADTAVAATAIDTIALTFVEDASFQQALDTGGTQFGE